MKIKSIEESKELKKQFERLGRAGIAKRAIELINQYNSEYPEHHYKEITKLIGRFHALYLSIPNDEYWKEIANRGYDSEINDLQRFEVKEVHNG